MEKLKIDRFLDENPSRTFPSHRTLPADECDALFTALRNRLALGADASAIATLNLVQSQSVTDESQNGENEDFSLAAYVKRRTAGREIEDVYINWYRFDRIDQVRLDAFSSDWKYFWYAGPDDLEIFDRSLDWVLSVDHDGNLYWLETPVGSRAS